MALHSFAVYLGVDFSPTHSTRVMWFIEFELGKNFKRLGFLGKFYRERKGAGFFFSCTRLGFYN